LNGDEITFGEIKVREPERRVRPDHDRRFACLAYEVPGAADLPIFLDRRAADAIERHALSDTSVELGGILLGKECVEPGTGQPYVWVNQSLEAKHYANTQASFTYTHDSWEEITRERDLRFPQYDIVGWYHTHPSFGIFLSHHDLFIHQNFFSQALQVAYVVDPINQTRGFFHWHSGGMAQVAGYYLTADRGDRIALARMANDLEQIPNTEGGSGGGLSPRLEAELINMLTRPGQRDVSSPVDKLQVAGFYGLIGVFLGVMGLATVLWLSQLLGKIQALDESIQASRRVNEESHVRLRLMTDGPMEQAGKDPINFLGRYETAIKARDEAEKRVANERIANELLENKIQALSSDQKLFVEALTTTKAKLAASEKDASEAAELRTRVAELEKEGAIQKGKLDEWDKVIDPETGKAAPAMLRSLAVTQVVAWIGWGCSALLAAALAASYFLLKPIPEAPLGEGEPDVERPTHRIE
jgi:proteasome lid subunit RPN8/RPN11